MSNHYRINNKKEFGMSEEDSLDETSEVSEVLPFMESFPFDEYEIVVEDQDETRTADLGITPILITALGKLELEKRVHFLYAEKGSKMMVSFFVEDLKYIYENQGKIEKLDSVREDLDAGLASPDFGVKIKKIRVGNSFNKLLDSKILNSPVFEGVIQDLCSIKDTALPSDAILALQTLKYNKALQKEFTARSKEVIDLYLNFQLHYSKIILGIVIAAKIH